MPLTRKRKVSAETVSANRANAPCSRGAATPVGKARSAAANLRHGYYSQAADVALAALGENPDEFGRRLDSQIDSCEPGNALEMGLVMQIAHGLWRIERFQRIAESLTVKHVEKAMEGRRQLEAVACYPLIGKMERLDALFNETCVRSNPVVGPDEMNLFEQCRAEFSPERANTIRQALLRLRKPGETSELPGPAGDHGDGEGDPVAEGEERKSVENELLKMLAVEIECRKRRFLGSGEDPDKLQTARDILVAIALPQISLLTRGELSSLRQVSPAAELLRRIKNILRMEETK